MAFELEDFTPVKIANVNPRSEKHGPDELHPAVDLSITLDAPNTILSTFDGALLSSLYTKHEGAGHGGEQQSLDGVEELSAFPNLRFPAMGGLKWAKDLVGYTLVIQHGLGGASDITLLDCKVNNFKIDPKEGGTVELKFRVQCSTSLDERTLGKLSLLIQNEVPIMLTAPEAKQEQQDLESPFPVNERDPQPTNPFREPLLTPEQAFENAVLQ